jgi:hypothetical protein
MPRLDSHYIDLDGALSSLDRRALDYRFDLDADIPWSRLGEAGEYLPVALLEDLGVDTTALRAHPQAWEHLQWASALGIAEGFIVAEQQVLDFL